LLGEAPYHTATEQSGHSIALGRADDEIMDTHAGGPVESKASLNLATESFGIIRK
jgi:thymidine phosphorylase